MDIELVLMVLVEEHLQQGQLAIDRHGFELSGLEAGSLIRVEGQETELLELDLI